MTVLITLTTAGTDSGPFSLYSNLDGFVTPFETGVSRFALEAGYTSTLVPDFTATVRVKSTGACTNYTDLPITGTTTTTSSSTTTSTTTIPAYVFSNGTILSKASSSGTVTETITGTLTVNSGPAVFHARINVNTGDSGYVNFTVSGIDASIISRSGSGISDGPSFSVPVGVYSYSLRVDATSAPVFTVVTGEIV